VRTCSIILSGGLSRRFQVPGEPYLDKALYLIDGKPMISRAYEAAVAVSNDVVIAINDWVKASIYGNFLRARFVMDEEPRGPLGGIAAGLRACGGDVALILPNDMPYITGNALMHLLDAVKDSDVATFILPNGALEAVMAIKVPPGIKLIDLMRRWGRSKVTDIYRALPVVSLLNASRRGVARQLINVNSREDIVPREVGDDLASGDILMRRRFDLELRGPDLDKSLWGTLSSGDPWSEARFYAENGALFLAAHALIDSINPNVKAMGNIILRKLKSQ